MKRFLNFSICILLISALLFNGETVSSQPSAGTAVCGHITTNATWTPAGSPYTVCASFGATINANVTVTIQPGTSVLVNSGAGNDITVIGSLIANGTAALPITFDAVSPAAGIWGGIWPSGSLATQANLTLDFVHIANAGANAGGEGAVVTSRANVSIDHTTISGATGNGVVADSTDHLTLNRTSFTNNGLSAVVLVSPNDQDMQMTGLTATGNGANVVYIESTTRMTGQRHWTNPGIHYLIDGNVSNAFGDVLTLDPGVTIEAMPSGQLTIGGQLNAIGTDSDPIRMTRKASTSGFWRGIVLAGSTNRAAAELDYVTVEYAGDDIGGAEVSVNHGDLIAHHSIFQFSQKDGVAFNQLAGGTVLDSQFLSNSLYGMRNAPANQGIIAGQNYWGAADGPTSDLTQCPVGHGQKVTSNVIYLPVQTSPGQNNPFPVTVDPILTLTPVAWYWPADNTRVYIDITLTDGNGIPLVGRQVILKTTLGTAGSGGITDAYGKSHAYIQSSQVGDAIVTGSLPGTNACESVVSPATKITFTPIVSTLNLFQDPKAPYAGTAITIDPQPTVIGVKSTVSTVLINPSDQPVTVNVTIGYVQNSIGLVFGPVAPPFLGKVVPAHGNLKLSASYIPSVSGHYCFQVSYSITAIGNRPVLMPQSGNTAGDNTNSHSSPTGNKKKDDDLDKTSKSLNAVKSYTTATYSPNPFAVPLQVVSAGLSMVMDWAGSAINALKGDPPRQDYTVISTPVLVNLSHVQPGGSITPARAAALNAVQDALAQANAYGTAAGLAFDRFGGASAASNMDWASIQVGVEQEYNSQFGAALIVAAGKIDDLIAEAASEGVTTAPLTADQAAAAQAYLAANGFSAQEIADAHALGLTDADLAALKAQILATRPEDMAGDMIVNMAAVSANFKVLGYTLQHPYSFLEGIVATGGAPQADSRNVLAQISTDTTTFQVGNPTASTATIQLSVRPVDLPAGWTADVSPAQVTLAAGAETTATVTIHPGRLAVQGTFPTVAVEGRINGTLIGGVVVRLVVPYDIPFDGHLKLYLPTINH